MHCLPVPTTCRCTGATSPDLPPASCIRFVYTRLFNSPVGVAPVGFLFAPCVHGCTACPVDLLPLQLLRAWSLFTLRRFLWWSLLSLAGILRRVAFAPVPSSSTGKLCPICSGGSGLFCPFSGFGLGSIFAKCYLFAVLAPLNKHLTGWRVPVRLHNMPRRFFLWGCFPSFGFGRTFSRLNSLNCFLGRSVAPLPVQKPSGG